MATLGGLAARLGEIDGDLRVAFAGAAVDEFGAASPPGTLVAPGYYCSYRGWYDRPCLVPASLKPDRLPTVDYLQEMTEDLVGKKLTGWKGGEYFMSDKSPVHVAREGETTDLVIADVVVSAESGLALVLTYALPEYF